MYTDTHFHFSYFSQNGEDFGTGILETMAKDSAFLGLDVGTKCDDLLSRRDFISDCIEAISDSNNALSRSYQNGIAVPPHHENRC